jgi:APA family basic amino acid/polyamine antiporter
VHQLFRCKPVREGGAHEDGAEPRLARTIGTFQLTMFGVGATVGTGIFFVLSQAVPVAGPATVLSFLVAGLAAGLSAICYAEMAASVPVSGSTYSYAYATLGEVAAIGVAACLLLEYGVSAAAVAVGWSGYLNKLLLNVFGAHFPRELSATPWDSSPGWLNLPAVVLVALCTALLIRGARESARANAVLVLVKLGALAMFSLVALSAFDADRFRDFAPFGMAGVTAAAGTIFFSFIGLDAVSTAGEEVKDPQRTMPRAILAALGIVAAIYLAVAIAALGAQPWQKFKGQEAGLAEILEQVTGATWPGTVLAAGAVVSIFSVTLVTLYGQTRILYAMARDGLLPPMFARLDRRRSTPAANTRAVSTVVAILAALVPLDALIDVVSIGTLVAFIVVSAGVIILRRTRPELPRPFRVPGYPVTPLLSIAACVWVLCGLQWITYLWFALWLSGMLAFYFAWGMRHSRLNSA